MQTLVPNHLRRAQFEAEPAEVAIACYVTPVELPADGVRRPACYLLLSELYGDDAELARSHGWPVIERLDGHLDVDLHRTWVKVRRREPRWHGSQWTEPIDRIRFLYKDSCL
jgi:hypothetical protein